MNYILHIKKKIKQSFFVINENPLLWNNFIIVLHANYYQSTNEVCINECWNFFVNLILFRAIFNCPHMRSVYEWEGLKKCIMLPKNFNRFHISKKFFNVHFHYIIHKHVIVWHSWNDANKLFERNCTLFCD